jgi:ABC-2 type transport system ATP-binding protein
VFTLKAHQLRVAYDSTVALRCPEIQLTGNLIGIIGHNGAGKSTFIKSILKLLPPTSGSLTVSDETGPLLPQEHMAFCPETGAVFSDIPVESYVKLWCRIKHNDPLYYRKESKYFSDLLALEPLLPKLGRELSKGQRRRVQTAIGFLTRPRLFLFDEPFDGLDVLRTRELAEIIQSEKHRTNFIISSHRMDVMERLVDILVVLRGGEFVASGPVAAVCRQLSPTATNLTDAMNAFIQE